MTRHSKNRNDLAYATKWERDEAGYSNTRKERLDGDSQLPFGFCSISLSVCKEPVASPYGHIYDRTVLLEFLVNQKEDLL